MKHHGIDFDKYGGRKMVLAEQVLWMTFVLALFSKLTAEWSGVAGLIIGAFMVADTVITHKALNEGVAKKYGKTSHTEESPE